MYILKDKVVAITGASSGIGKALAYAALSRGAKVAVCARNIAKLEETFASVDKDRILMVQVDVSKEEDCKRFVDDTVQKWGGVDVLLNNAGISMRALFEEVELSVIKELMDINFWGSVYCTKYALKHILKAKGVILGVSSIAGYRGLPGRMAYSSSKFALQGFLESLRTELLNTGVHVMWVCPGFTESNIRKVARSSDGSPQQESPLKEQKLMSADEVAERTIVGIEKRKRTLVMTFQGKLTVFVNKLFPGFADKQVYKHFLHEPDSPLRKYETND
ncbi:MAG: SDR family oxidoreductase [Chitinophagales bacterium]|nr:SDR family oxidoreductase [Chitinophagaceae bacterium]MCB9065884.1 SDR family oxidoreductase [Chitinophagales bacterium]